MSVTPLLSRAGRLLLSVVSTKAANMMLSEGMASLIFHDVVRQNDDLLRLLRLRQFHRPGDGTSRSAWLR